jgi:hypothetical protein
MPSIADSMERDIASLVADVAKVRPEYSTTTLLGFDQRYGGPSLYSVDLDQDGDAHGVRYVRPTGAVRTHLL